MENLQLFSSRKAYNFKLESYFDPNNRGEKDADLVLALKKAYVKIFPQPSR
ncbi:MAG: hypothetical protein LBL34_05295 [Clostridiales bacterium]|jgi:hypothetical protein|nr:hypothetical protein [Clostridiales bacterium]